MKVFLKGIIFFILVMPSCEKPKDLTERWLVGNNKEFLIGKWGWEYSIRTTRDKNQGSYVVDSISSWEYSQCYAIRFQMKGQVNFSTCGSGDHVYVPSLKSYKPSDQYLEFRFLFELANPDEPYLIGYLGNDTILLLTDQHMPFESENTGRIETTYKHYLVKK